MGRIHCGTVKDPERIKIILSEILIAGEVGFSCAININAWSPRSPSVNVSRMCCTANESDVRRSRKRCVIVFQIAQSSGVQGQALMSHPAAIV